MTNAYRIRLVRDKIANVPAHLESAAAVAGFCQRLAHLDREHLVRLDLDTRCGLIAEETVHIGTLDAIAISPREIFRGGLLSCARQIIVVHNHPSGNPSPSDEDQEFARRLGEAGKLLDLPVADFVVIGDDGRFWSEKAGYGTIAPSSLSGRSGVAARRRQP